MDMWGPRIIKAVKKSCELDLIHAQSTTFLYPPMFDTFPLFLGKTPLVVTAHDVPHYRQFHALPFLHLIYSRAKSIIVLSHHVARELKHYHGNVVGSKVRVMHHGVDVERFRPDVSTKPFYEWLNLEPSFFTFMSFGFLGQGKGTDLAVKAFKKFLVRHSKSNIDFRFIIAGSPRDADQGYATSLKSLIDELRLKSQVIITGYVPSDLVPSALASADVLVYPYLGVSQSGPVHRSLATGRPVVVSDIEGFREIITDGDNGLLIRENDVDSISNAFDRLYTNESVRLQIGDGARQYAEKFLDWKKVAGDTLELYRSITKTQRATCQEFQDGAEVD
jgi:glycosyltransferase involved in cell wall biosynthesis